MYNWECDCDDECRFALHAPGDMGNPTEQYIEDRAFSCFAMEAEGDLPTRRGKIQKVVKYLSEVPDPNDFDTQCEIYRMVGIDSDTFTDDEVDYIQKEVARRM